MLCEKEENAVVPDSSKMPRKVVEKVGLPVCGVEEPTDPEHLGRQVWDKLSQSYSQTPDAQVPDVDMKLNYIRVGDSLM